ncbi:hypothetical protein [Halalkalibacter urbisdiaboli]|uniref:hypothetical protein n=1 Tax=Halalkalibacter urbisdiaboli TaxID=1960589 RepID=UPI001055D3B9|nr:hypothetical protein [Halalkalibacter urbisdiaboli]
MDTFTRDFVIVIAILLVFISCLIWFSIIQHERDLIANIQSETQWEQFELNYVGKETNGPSEIYKVSYNGEDYIFNVYQDKRTINDYFNVTSDPELNQRLMNIYALSW